MTLFETCRDFDEFCKATNFTDVRGGIDDEPELDDEPVMQEIDDDLLETVLQKVAARLSAQNTVSEAEETEEATEE